MSAKYKSFTGFMAAVIRQYGTDVEYRILSSSNNRMSVGVFEHNIPVEIHGWNTITHETYTWCGNQIDGWRVLKNISNQN